MASAYPSRRGSAPPMSAPDSGSRTMPWPPPTIHDQSSIAWTSCPRSTSPARVSDEMRDSASTSRSRYTRTRGAYRFLDVHPDLEHVEEHLGRGLENPVRARRADRDVEDSVPENLGRRHHRPRLSPGP